MKKPLLGAVLLLLIAVMALSGWQIWKIFRGYQAGQAAYGDLLQFVEEPPLPEQEASIQNEASKKPSSEAGTEKWPVVDFQALQKINPDIIAWLSLPGTAISYPVIQGKDNEEYLRTLVTGEPNDAGSIFLESKNSRDFSDTHSIIYGHNMQDGSMFAGLLQYKQQQFYNSHPVALLLTPEKNYEIEIFAGRTAEVTEDAWKLDLTEENFDEWLTNATVSSCFTGRSLPCADDRIVTLSTCSNAAGDARFVLHGILRENP